MFQHKIIKIIFNIVIVVVNMCASENYDWNVRTIDRDSDFSDDLKVQTALNNERQQDLLKFSGQTNNKGYSHNSYFDPIKSNIDYKDNKVADGKGIQNQFSEKIYKKPEKDFHLSFDENNSYNQAQDSEKEPKSYYGYDEDYDQNEDHQKKYRTNENIVFGDQERGCDDLKQWKDPTKQNENHNPKLNKNIVNETYIKNENNTKLPLLSIESFVGTNLFDNPVKKCFSNEDVALLAIRKDFEGLIPKYLPPSLLDDHMVALLLNYFYICHQMVIGTSSIRSRNLVQKAFYDTIGGYLHFYMVPVTKYSFYAGQISLNTAKQILLLHEESRKFLNTNGNGWRAPLQNILVELRSIHIEPLHFYEREDDAHGEPSFCMQLDMDADESQPDNDKMIVQLPKIEAENLKGYLGNIWLPFKRKKTFDLKLENSAYIVNKFYKTVTKCYQFENIDQNYFNQQFKTWLSENINMHLSDEEFYPGLGAVLRISEYLKGYQKHFIGIEKDISAFASMDEKFNNYRSYKMGKKIKLIKAKVNRKNSKEKNNSDLEKPNGENIKLIKTSAEKDNKTEHPNNSVTKTTKGLLRTLDFPPTQIVIITIPVVAVILVIMVCCWKCFCKKKKPPPVQVKPVKNSSSSSSNLFNSPVRFFHTKKKRPSNSSAIDYSSNEISSKKSKKSVKIEKIAKIEKKPLINSDTSASSSPIRSRKSKESNRIKGGGKSKDSDKSNV